MPTTDYTVTRPPGFWNRLTWWLRHWADWSIAFGESSLTLKCRGNEQQISYIDLLEIAQASNTTLKLKLAGDEAIVLPCPKNSVSPQAMHATLLEVRQETLLKHIKTLLEGVALPTQTPYDLNSYISNYRFSRWRDSLPDAAQLDTALEMHDRLHPTEPNPDFGQLETWRRYKVLLKDSPSRREQHNEQFIAKELQRTQQFFDQVESLPLTSEQRVAAIEMEDRNLLVAAAGSGKTSAVVGKVGYALEAGICQPSEILVLAFNKKAADELQERLADQLGEQASQTRISTFHKFGLDTIGQARDSKPAVADWTANLGESSASNNLWQELIQKLLDEDPAFARHYWQLRLCFSYNMKPQHQFNSRNEYEVYLESSGAKARDEESRRNWGVQTIQGEWVRSLQELTIANWLYLHGINYQYEAPYRFDTATAEHREYKPDFYYPDADLYHEHFALDEHGEAPRYFDKGYAEEAEWKRQEHSRRGTKLIETTSAMFSNGTVLKHLQTELERHGIDCSQQISQQEINAKLGAHAVVPIHDVIQQFMLQWKSSGLSFGELENKANNLRGYGKLRAKVFLRVVDSLRQAYEAKLRDRGEVDFEDMITMATECLAGNKFKHPYKLVLVDEFQDISQSRAKLVKALLAQKPECTLFAVGDDWQSIYRFAGSDINIMTNFSQEFGITARNDLTMTFRSNQGITQVATRFISDNPAQLTKKVRAHDPEAKSVVNVVSYNRFEAVEPFIEQKLAELSAGEKPASIFILGRYNNDRPNRLAQWQRRFKAQLDIKFSTVHAAKGKEADYVFILGLQAGRYGFPCERLDDALMSLVRPQAEEFPFAEERRLFYVALTRAKHQSFLLAPSNRPSSFVAEVLAMGQGMASDTVTHTHIADQGQPDDPPNYHPEPCPSCGAQLVERTSRYGQFFGCTNYPKCEGKRKKEQRKAHLTR